MSISNAAILPTPNFTWDPVARPPIAGLRPYRDLTYRLEPENVGNKFVVHNYGHGGAGITLSWGCAQEVIDIVRKHGVAANDSIAVIGAGVMGLTAASLLLPLNLKLRFTRRSFRPIRHLMLRAGNGRRRWSTIKIPFNSHASSARPIASTNVEAQPRSVAA